MCFLKQGKAFNRIKSFLGKALDNNGIQQKINEEIKVIDEILKRCENPEQV